MPKLSDTAIARPSRISNTTKRLIGAAALASALIPLAAVPVESATISCISDGGGSGSNNCGSGGGQGFYSPGSGTNTWKFYDSGFFDVESQQTVYQNLIYTVEIFGDPTSEFTLNLHDTVVAQSSTALNLSAFPGTQCIPIFNEDNCAYFSVEVLSGSPSWADGYYTMLINWFTNPDPVSQPPITATNRILKAEVGTTFTQSLIDSTYDPAPTPTDPALGGRGDTFSNFVPTTSAPEPTTMMLLGTALGAALIRRRRNR